MKRLLLAVALAFSAPAFADPAFADPTHGDSAEMQSVPADDAALDQAPTQIVLSFKQAAVLKSVELHAPGEVKIPLNFTAGAAEATRFTVPVPALRGAGVYEVHWEAKTGARDLRGTFHFRVN